MFRSSLEVRLPICYSLLPLGFQVLTELHWNISMFKMVSVNICEISLLFTWQVVVAVKIIKIIQLSNLSIRGDLRSQECISKLTVVSWSSFLWRSSSRLCNSEFWILIIVKGCVLIIFVFYLVDASAGLFIFSRVFTTVWCLMRGFYIVLGLHFEVWPSS